MAGGELHIQEFGSVRRRSWAHCVGADRFHPPLGLAGWLGQEPQVARYRWTGLVSQAGVAMGLATMIADRLPGVGLAVEAVTVSVIAFNESLGPLFRWGLREEGSSRSIDSCVIPER